MSKLSNQKGFSSVELLLVAVVVVVIAGIGYFVYNRQSNTKQTGDDTAQTTEQSAVANDVSDAPQINTVSDLDNAAKILDKTDPAGSNSKDSQTLETQAATF